MKVTLKFRIVAVIFFAFMLVHSASAKPDELYFVDAHSQVDESVVPLTAVISLMEQGGVTHTLLSTRGKLQGKALLAFVEQYPDRITPAIRTKGNPYNAGSPRYYRALQAQVASGKYSAIAEILLYHAKKGSKAPEVVVYPDDRRVLTALSYAVENQWPFVIHIEFASLHGEKKKRFKQSMETMLDSHPELPFVLSHMGQLGPDECRRLIQAHSNIYFHTGWSNPAAVRRSNQPWVNLFEDYRLAPEWKNLFIRHPDRFIFALDNVFDEHWTGFYLEQMEYWKKALVELPAEVAHRVAHGNAERLWRISRRISQ
jgi:predicted TIM-barrel fold metal-dependent hydrolase